MVDEQGNATQQGTRMWMSSLPAARLTLKQWSHVARHYWYVEQTHHALDTTFGEDEHVIIDSNERGAMNCLLFRRMAHNLVAFYRTVTQRADQRRRAPYRQLLSQFWASIIAATDAQLEGLRRRPESAAPRA